MTQSPRKLAIFDLDGTVYRWQLYHEIVFCLKDMGMFPADAVRQLDHAYYAWKNRQASFDAYERTVVHTLIDSLPNIPPHIFDEAAQKVAAAAETKIYRYTVNLTQQLKKEGYFLLAVSGSQQEVVELFARRFDFDDCIGSLYERKGDRFTGTVSRFIPGNKERYIKEYARDHNFSLTGSVAVGDSGGDISMLDLVDHPIAFNPSADLLTIARERHWKIVIERKNVTLTLETNEQGQTTLTSVETY